MKSYILGALAAVTIVFFAGLYLNERSRKVQIVERKVPVDRVVEKRVEVPLERIVEKRVEVPVEKIVERRVEVPAPIPNEYETAYKLYKMMESANNKHPLEGVTYAKVVVLLDENAEKLVSKSAIQNKLELALRRNGIEIRDDSDQRLIFSVETLADKFGTSTRYTYLMQGCFYGVGVAFNNGGVVKHRTITLWEKTAYGYAPSNDLAEVATKNSTEFSDEFCNEWLKDNPKAITRN